MDVTPGSYMDAPEPAFFAETDVETALNSRCSSDADSDQSRLHWGMYDLETHISDENLHALERGVQVPRFTYSRLDVDFDQRPVVLAISAYETGLEQKWLNIESGMQHQAIHLVCAAVGMGTCILNLGIDGQFLYGELLGTARMRIEMMRPSYQGSLWSNDAPGDWVADPTLPEPRRSGGMLLLQAMENLAVAADGRNTGLEDISQLLWAARGRTPHLYFGKSCGLTIPVWNGVQEIASVYLVKEDGTFRYVNWRDGKPTHALEQVDDTHPGLKHGEVNIVLSVGETSARALWEVGYMLENLFVQAISLGVKYRSVLLDPAGVCEYATTCIPDAAAVFTVHGG